MSTNSFLRFLRSRLAQGASQTRLASQFGVTPSQVGHWLSGRRAPCRTVLLLAEYIALYVPVNAEDSVDRDELASV